MSFQEEYKALLSLLDDPDDEVNKEISDRILMIGDEILPYLKESVMNNLVDTPSGISRLNDLIDEIEFRIITTKLKNWCQNPVNLLEGVAIIGKMSGTDLGLAELNKEIEKIKMEVWLELRPDLTALEKVRVLNHVFYQRFAFRGDKDSYHDPDNSYLHRVFKRKKGNPISLSIIYSVVAQRLFIPIFGINLPHHFVLAYIDIPDLPEPGADSKGFNHLPPKGFPELFYINVFSDGSIFGRKHIDSFLEESQIKPRPEFYEPCSNKEIVIRVLRNLHNAFGLRNQVNQINKVNRLIELIEKS